MVLNKLIMVFHLKCIFLLMKLLFVIVSLLLRRRGKTKNGRNKTVLSVLFVNPFNSYLITFCGMLDLSLK